MSVPGEFSFCASLSHLSGNLCLQDGTARGLGTSHGTLAGKRRHCLVYRKNRGCMCPCLRSGVWLRSRQRLGFRRILNEVWGCFFPLVLFWAGLSYSTTPRTQAAEGQRAHCKKCPSQQDWSWKRLLQSENLLIFLYVSLEIKTFLSLII